MRKRLSYKKAGVDIGTADMAKEAMAKSLETSDSRVLNRIGAYASLYDGRFPGYEHPVLVLKTEEPGSKQKLAFEFDSVSSICHDMVNHLINDIIVMGAEPLAVQDAIICGKLEKEVVSRIVGSIAQACREQGCVLTGGETSEQPGVLDAGTYILVASMVGVVEKSNILDGARIEVGDRVVAVASNGLHTNGYSLVRALISQNPEILRARIGRVSFKDAILEPHKCYHRAFEGLLEMKGLHGLAHITGGGIEGNLCRILPKNVDAVIDLSQIRVLPIFKFIKDMGHLKDSDMLQTFNMGVGMTMIAHRGSVTGITNHLLKNGCESYEIGEITKGNRRVVLKGKMNWKGL